jgi:uncharacterized membrane protein YidH (DUF202 family)
MLEDQLQREATAAGPGDSEPGPVAPAAAMQLAPSAIQDGSERRREAPRPDRQRDDERRQRAVASTDRELLSWSRMAMTLVATGIGAERALTYLSTVPSGRLVDPHDVLHSLAIGLVGLGLAVLAVSSYHTLAVHRAVRAGTPLPKQRILFSLLVGLGLMVIFGIALVAVIWFRVVPPWGTADGPSFGPIAESAERVHPRIPSRAGGVS